MPMVAWAGGKGHRKRRYGLKLAAARSDEWKQCGAWAAQTLASLLFEDCFGIFCHLVGRFKIAFVSPVIFIFTADGRVIPTDLRPCFIDPTAVVSLQMLADGMHQ